MMESRENWRLGVHTVLTLMLVFAAIMQSAVFAQPPMPTAQHSHVEKRVGQSIVAQEVVESFSVEKSVASVVGEAIAENCEQHCLSGFYLPTEAPPIVQPVSRNFVAAVDDNLTRGNARANDRPPKTVS
ncbi:hypothetical protein CU102_27060 [Phyllobacterium brassicacearum]|uniref:Uncharacterized protein n=1 Tax=Phyllobacterium brassicacearum TaxID=314235 RepID=A0A2P7B4P4_9HYPH|nr:hypothetical protein [Phyllobacterium brassicacearum]PSH61432.1 hypothetical protein CU102_27060 [Phyllobacterium brassicacearum]TDQ13489.1 hypothetical protein DEV91_14214 [Phyllobacterium brassicacearum]